jgi:quinol monooxygenase YgiN
MVERIVRLEFAPDKVVEFKTIFEEVKAKVRNSPGCLGMTLFVDAESPSVFYTISQWDSEEHLEAYRHSDLFQSSWSRMRVLFNGKPQAFTIKEVDKGANRS